MADVVQATMEAMVPELDDFRERGVFSDAEIKAIVKKRRDFEWLFSKRAPESDDFSRALSYELSLESLRAERKTRLGLKKSTLGDHSIVRRVHFIFDRACRRFRQHPQWWLQWADFALRTNSAKAVGRIFARALQLHPRSVELWLQAAEFEYDRQGNVGSARSLLLRALRVNSDSRPLWLAYFRMECLYVQKMRGRRLLLGGKGMEGGSAVLLGGGAGGGVEEKEDLSGGYAPPLLGGATGEEEGVGGGGGGKGAGEEEPSTSDPTSLAAQVASGLLLASDSGAPPPASAAAAAKEKEELGGFASPAEAAFFAGAVPRIVFEQSRSKLPPSLDTFAAFLAVTDEFTDAVGAAEVETLGGKLAGTTPIAASLPLPLAAAAKGAAALGPSAGAPAFPALSDAILGAMADTFPEDPGAWRVIAERGLERLKTSARRVAGRVGRGGGGEGRGGGDKVMKDVDLFVVDTLGTSKGEEEKEEGEGEGEGEKKGKKQPSSSSSSSSSASASGGARSSLVKDRATEEAFAEWRSELMGMLGSKRFGPLGPTLGDIGGVFSPLTWSACLSSGIIDTLCVHGCGEGESDGLDSGSGSGRGSGAVEKLALCPTLPPFSAPLWVVVDGQAGGSGGGKKRGREEVGGTTAPSPSSPPTLVVPNSPSSPLSDDSPIKLLLTWSQAVAHSSSKVYAMALAAAAAVAPSASAASAPAPASHRRVLQLHLSHAATLCSLLLLPIPSCPENTLHSLALLQRLLDVCTPTPTPTSSTSSSSSHSPAHAEEEGALARLRIQALFRLGRVREALEVAVPTYPPPSKGAIQQQRRQGEVTTGALISARCLRLCRAVAAAAGGGGGRKGGGGGGGAIPAPSLLRASPPLKLGGGKATTTTTTPPLTTTTHYLSSLAEHLQPFAAITLPSLLRAPLESTASSSSSSSSSTVGGGGGGGVSVVRHLRPSPPSRSLLWCSLLQCAFEGGEGEGEGRDVQRAPPPFPPSALPLLRECLLDGLGPSHEAPIRELYLQACASLPPGVCNPSHITPALGPQAPPSVHESAFHVLVGSGALSPPQLRTLLDLSVAAHGGVSVGLWVSYLRLERSAKPPLMPPPDVITRARRALQGKGEASSALEEAAALINAGFE